MIAAGSRSHNQYNLFFPDNRKRLFIYIMSKKKSQLQIGIGYMQFRAFLKKCKNLKTTGFPFDFAQGGESFDFAQNREPVERRVEPPPARE